MFKNEFECLHKIRENIKNRKKYSKQDLIEIKKICQSIVDSFDDIDLNKIEDVQYGKICYICKDKIKKTHSYYSEMCFKCGNFNQFHRDMIKPLSGKVAVVTGGRVKIGFETALKLLRGNCIVIVTSRFVKDTLERYSKEKDFDLWKDRLIIYSLDLMSFQNINEFVLFLESKFEKIDILINNAAQTIDRPINFYQQIIGPEETVPLSLTYIRTNFIESEKKEYFPEGQLDEFGQQLDLRPVNSWILQLTDVSFQEVTKVFMINTLAPFILVSKLRNLLTKNGCIRKNNSWIINVSSMEGKFNWKHKKTIHPHTNMAKAALNMMTRTSGKDYASSNIIMVSVDTGWNNSQYPNSYEIKTPLDCIDGAARILHPIYNNLIHHSVFYKDYEVTTW